MFPSLPPSSDRRAEQVARQRTLLRIAVWLFIISAIVVLVLPIHLPRPVRLSVVAMDLIAAAVIWLLARQRYGR